MKKILSLAVLLVFSLAMYAQKDVTKFLGIPVDGTKSEMIKKLKEKGFTESSYDKEVLEGEFNGMDVNISVVTNNNKVYRIFISDTNATMNETNIRIKFNTLYQQFKNNKKYISLSEDLSIPEDEDISYEITVHNKRYEAIFYQIPDSASMVQNMLSKYTREELNNMTEEEQKEVMKNMTSYALDTTSKKCVWFMIVEHFGSFHIVMYYDNEYNKAQGDDL
ncbi:MAG TPA: hypothetical protein H9818_03510 [Candidatus Phocaeicola gallistercoris]|nr:hypothetical protein [Candidatus Phocaeicola gallistercoris]